MCLCPPRPDKCDVYLLLKELDEKVVKMPFPALGTGFKVPTQSQITQASRRDRVLQMDFSVRVAPLAIVPSWVLTSLDLETACPSRSCQFEVLFPVPASGHQTYWCRTPSRYKFQFHAHRFGLGTYSSRSRFLAYKNEVYLAAKWYFPALNGLLIILIQEQADSEGVKFEVSLNGGTATVQKSARPLSTHQHSIVVPRQG